MTTDQGQSPIIPAYAPAPVSPALASTPPAARGRNGLATVVVVLAVLLVVAAGIATWALTRGSDSPPAVASTASASAGTLPIAGTLVLVNSSGVLNIDNEHCQGMGGYQDIRPGTSITVTDATGTTIGVGSLLQGLMIGSGATRTCSFPFAVEVPAGKSFYGVEIAHRGRVNFPEADLRKPVQLSLGG